MYTSRPPAWLPKVHSTADLGKYDRAKCWSTKFRHSLGYLGFFPPRTGQEEGLSETNVKNGFTLDPQVLAETFSAHTIINGDLSSETTFYKLEALMNEIFARKADSIPLIPPATFRIPTRVTLNDSKRQSWFADLANPDVPLYKLGKSVPHGAKGHDLLDLLQSNNVAIPRAVWFLRVFGANETAGLRNKPAYNPLQYSVDWANVVTSYMKKQLADVALPSAPRPGLNIKQTFKGVLSDGDTRERWISRFVYWYDLKLLRTFYSEGLVDSRTFLVWVVQQMNTCNLAQAGFVTRLADEYLDGMLGSRPLTRPLLHACLSKLSELLNSISSSKNMKSIQFFSRSTDDEARFTEKLDMLLTWCVTPLQFGDHRPFAAVTLIRDWRMDAADRATRRHSSPPDEFLQDRLFDWLDSSSVAADPENIRSVSLLYGKLVKHELFSYASYIQRLVARGESGLLVTEDRVSRHRKFLQWIPLSNSTSSLISQRRVTLYGVRAREMPEDVNEREIRREIRRVLYDVFGGSVVHLLTATNQSLIRPYRGFSPASNINIHLDGANPSPVASTYIEKVFLKLTLCLLEYSATVDLLIAVIDTFHRYSTIWACMDEFRSIVAALDKAHQVWKARGIQSRPLLSLLLDFDGGRYLSDVSRERIEAEFTMFTLALQPATEHPDIVPDVLPEILLLAGDPDQDAPSLLANSLWIKYRKSNDWAWKVWDNTVASLRQVPIMTSDEAGRRACALRYGMLLWHVDEHLAMGLDSEVLRWFLGPGRNEVAALNLEAWDLLIVVLLYLSVHGALKTTTILQGVVYPAWQQAANVTTNQPSSAVETFLRSANEICRRLLLLDDINHDLPPVDLFELQCIRTRRQDVYGEAHFPLLASSIPVLISLQNNKSVSEKLRGDSTSVRHLISQNQDFRQGAYRNLDAIRAAFEHSLQPRDARNGILNKHLVAGLRLLLYDIDVGDDIELSEWPAVTSLLSPWKIAATMVQMQLILREMGQELLRDPTNTSAHTNLDRLILMLFNHSMTSEEAFYVGEMAKGLDNTVTGKFVNNGLRCITERVRASTSITPSNSSSAFLRAGELLLVLIHVSEPLREETTLPAVLETSSQEDLMEALLAKLNLMESLIISDSISDIDETLMQDMILFLRLLQFEMGFRGTWTAKLKESTDTIVSSLFKVLISTINPTSILCPLILDTLYYIYDEIPIDLKATPLDLFRHYPSISPTDLPLGLPVEHRKQILSLLPLSPNSCSVSNMVNSQRDTAGNLVYGTSVVNRPWEWIENLGEPTTDASEEDRDREDKERLESKYAVKNTGSLSLEDFGARLTGDGVSQTFAQDSDHKRSAKLRSFEDGLSGENIFERDWRETRVDLQANIGNSAGRQRTETEEEACSSSQFVPSKIERRMTPRGSPAPSNVSRSSARGSAGSGASVRPSPQGPVNRNSGSTMSDIIDVDSGTTVTPKQSSTQKRKVPTTAMESDDEIEIVEGPIPARISKKPKVKASVKGRPKRK
ncbi:hypothetical protein C0993_006705 [Termitomyces sp. T159_Od127]|nr:hypothetical protein C0993_006705 [Termitomyces sp. T159_Od127]